MLNIQTFDSNRIKGLFSSRLNGGEVNMAVSDQLCPCQSGAKAKECCFSKKNITLEKHWTAIKGRILQIFISEHPSEVEIDEIQNWVGLEKMQRFEERMDAATLQHLLVDAYFFTENRKQWGFHLMKSMKEIVQPRTHMILSSWQKPYYFIGKVNQIVDDFVVTKHIWTDEIVYLADVDVDDPVKGDLLLGHVVPGVNPHFYNLLSSAIVLENAQSYVLDYWKEGFEKSDYSDLESYFEKELLNCLFDLIAETAVVNNEDKNVDIHALQLIISLDMLLIDLDIKSDRLTFIFFNYLMDHISTMRIRKKEALVGAILDFGIRYEFIPKVITQRKLAELFSVAPSTIAKYSRKIGLYYDQDLDLNMLDKIRQPSYKIGTDPTQDEYEKWQIERKLEKMVFATDLEKKRMEKKLLGTVYKPVKKVHKAQKYAYEAYLAKSKEKRIEWAKLAYMNDAKNKDANLILAEQKSKESRLKILDDEDYSSVGKAGKLRLLLLKITLLYSLQKYDEAFEAVKTLNPQQLDSHQQLYYFYSMLHFMKGNDKPLQQQFSKISDDSAIKQWIIWAVANEHEDETTEALHLNAIQSNLFVQKYIELDILPYDFPSNQVCSKGDPNEAKMIHFILFPFLK